MNLALWGIAGAIFLSCLITWYLTVSVMVRNRERADQARAQRARQRYIDWPGLGDWAYPQPEEPKPHRRPKRDNKPLPGTWEAPPNEGPGAAIPADKWPTTTTGGAYDG